MNATPAKAKAIKGAAKAKEAVDSKRKKAQKRTGRAPKIDKWRTPEGLLKLEDWARSGLTDEQIAKNIGISRSTLAKWKVDFSDISDTLKRGKEIVDIEVENALLKKALGGSYTETTEERVVDKDGGVSFVVTKKVTKEIPPDTTAIIFWLKNRKAMVWRDKVTQEIEAPDVQITWSAEHGD